MKVYSLQDAKSIVAQACKAADANAFSTRESFLEYLDQNPHLATQGYNAYGKIFHWNEAASHLFGYRETEAINQDLVELILPQEVRLFARNIVSNALKTGKMPEPGCYDLLHFNGHYITVYSGHLVFMWEDATTPEFYCINLPIDSDPSLPATTSSRSA